MNKDYQGGMLGHFSPVLLNLIISTYYFTLLSRFKQVHCSTQSGHNEL